MAVFGIISEQITDQTKHYIGQYPNSKYIYTYSGSIVNNSSSTLILKLLMQTQNGQNDAEIIIPANQIVRFKNLKFEGWQSMTASPNAYILAVQYLKEKFEGLSEESEIFYV